MKILFLCTAYNSLSQRVALVLKSKGHSVTVELALSSSLMISAVELAAPDIVICPFLTKRVPREVYTRWLTLIVHPGPPGDAGPSAIDWCLIGDTGEEESFSAQINSIDVRHSSPAAQVKMRSHWGVTVLQAIEALDAGPIWAFDQFELDNETSRMTKSDLYRGPVTRCAVNGVLAAIDRIRLAADASGGYSTDLQAPERAGVECVSNGLPFLGGKTHERPLLKASMRDFIFPDSPIDVPISADVIVQRINSADSQPGVLTSLLGVPLFVYNAFVQRDPLPDAMAERARCRPIGAVLASREGAVLVTVGADFPIWICQIRIPKAKTDKQLQPKLPAVMALLSMPSRARSLGLQGESVPEWCAVTGFGSHPTLPWRRRPGTYQQVTVELEQCGDNGTIGYVYTEFYNGAFSTMQCELLLEALEYTLSQPSLKAIVMMGGSGYFSNGIALNVIEGAEDPSAEGWANIQAIDDCVEALLAPSGVLTFSAMRGNAAAGGLALATAADVVLSVESAVHNPHYRGLGLYGSEYHTYSWTQRCGARVAAELARRMLPISAAEAKSLGLVDHIIDNGNLGPQAVVDEVKTVVRRFLAAHVIDAEEDGSRGGDLFQAAPWTRSLMPTAADNVAHRPLVKQLVTNKAKFLSYLFGEGSGQTLSLRESFGVYRKRELEQMKLDFFHPIRGQRFTERRNAFVRKVVPSSTPTRFALHRRFESLDWHQPDGFQSIKDEEELDEFDSLGNLSACAAEAREPLWRPELRPTYVGKKSAKVVRSASDSSDSSRRSRESGSTAPTTAPASPRSEPTKLLVIGEELETVLHRHRDEAKALERQKMKSHASRRLTTEVIRHHGPSIKSAERLGAPSSPSTANASTSVATASASTRPARSSHPRRAPAELNSKLPNWAIHDRSSHATGKTLYHRFKNFMLVNFPVLRDWPDNETVYRSLPASESPPHNATEQRQIPEADRREAERERRAQRKRPASYAAPMLTTPSEGGGAASHDNKVSRRSSLRPGTDAVSTSVKGEQPAAEHLFGCYYEEDGSRTAKPSCQAAAAATATVAT